MPLPSPGRATVPAAASRLTAGLLEGAPRTATVLAAYRFGVYLDVAGSVLPVVTADAVPLPTALLLAGRAGSMDWWLAPGDRVLVGDGRVALPSVDLVVARTWRPARVTRTSASRRSVSSHTLLRVGAYPTSASRGSGEGAGWLVDGIRDAVLLSHGSGSRSDHLDERLLGDAVSRLVGRGPGLTPSGDDALAGALLVSHGLGAGGRLAAAVRERLRATTAVSAALLDAAADGYAARPVVGLVDAVLAGDAAGVRTALPAVLGIGHSSGRDLVTGVSTALDALLPRRDCGAARRSDGLRARREPTADSAGRSAA